MNSTQLVTVTNPVLWTALVTPMDELGNIHYPDLEKLLRMQADAGLGVVLFGSTGEGLNLSSAEKKEILKFTKNLNLNLPLMIGVGGMDHQGVLSWLDFCEDMDVHSYLMVTPLYAKPGPIGQTKWFETLLNRVKRPCMLYNIPSRAGVSLSRVALKNLEKHPNLWAIKEASGSIEEFEKFRQNTPNVEIFSGDDGMLPFFYPLGVKGLVSIASNLWPVETLAYTKKCLKGELLGLFPLWSEVVETLFEVSNPVPVKAGLHALSMIEKPNLRLPLTHLELKSCENILLAHKKLQQWMKDHV